MKGPSYDRYLLVRDENDRRPGKISNRGKREDLRPHLTLRSFGDRLIELLPAMMGELSRHESHYLARGVITLSQARALTILVKHGPCPMHQLAEMLYLKMPSVTSMMDRMIKHRLVARERNQHDRRIVAVTVTAKGRQVFNDICERKKEGLLKMFGKLSAEDRATYLEIVEKLVKLQSKSVISKKRGFV